MCASRSSHPCPAITDVLSNDIVSFLTNRRPAFNVLCEKSRAQFEAQKHLKDFGEIDAAFADAESKLFVHPEPYILGWDRGGTAFMRNPPPGFHVRVSSRVASVG